MHADINESYETMQLTVHQFCIYHLVELQLDSRLCQVLEA